MRNAIVVVAVAVLGSALSCAASRTQVEVAQTARYRGDPLAMFQAARAAVADKYRIATSDENALRIETAGRWYTAEGLGASERFGDIRDVPDRSIHLRLIVRLMPQGSDWSVAIQPVMMRYFTGRPNPDPLPPDDPSLPGWTHGRVEQLYAAVHQALESYQVQRAPATTTPPEVSPQRQGQQPAEDRVAPASPVLPAPSPAGTAPR